jgi:2-oxoglutarate dehydrogenase E1 component
MERFLIACAEYNMTVANVTTPANFFHLIRRQLARPFRKPLVLMSPKSLLRHPLCVSSFEDFTKGSFKEIYDDATISNASNVKKVLFCSGKIYYELMAKREADKREDIAIVRLEQVYPFPKVQINALMEKYKAAKFCWVQEESSNMGAWQFILTNLRNNDIELISRKPSASPATGFKKQHAKESAEIMSKAFS